MSRKDEAVTWLKRGKSPTQIAHEMGISCASVEQYLYTKVGEGAIRRSDLLFSIDPLFRQTIEAYISKVGEADGVKVFYAAKKDGQKLNKDEIRIYLLLRDARVSRGDMYEFISEIETALLHEWSRIRSAIILDV